MKDGSTAVTLALNFGNVPATFALLEVLSYSNGVRFKVKLTSLTSSGLPQLEEAAISKKRDGLKQELSKSAEREKCRILKIQRNLEFLTKKQEIILTNRKKNTILNIVVTKFIAPKIAETDTSTADDPS